MILEKYELFLEKEGYSKYTPSGHPSTVYDYSKRIKQIADRESISIDNLFENINKYVNKYDTHGVCNFISHWTNYTKI